MQPNAQTPDGVPDEADAFRGCDAIVEGWRQVEIPMELYRAIRELQPESKPPFRARPFDVQLIGAMVLYGGYVQGSEIRDGIDGDSETQTLLALIRKGWGQRGGAFLTALSSLYMPDATRAQMESFIDMQLHSATPEDAVVLRRGVGLFDVSEVLDRVRCPVLVAHGRDDAVQPFEQGRWLAQALPDARFLALDSASHVPLPQLPAWEALMHATDRFLLDAGD